ncbi:MAG TPA: FtsX-like permease family protein [Flavisolibacter sp.]|jgi:putative ABC transport system permease protein|nr:FtsX-like permease family protein [Flavisolibacter sp.]
MLRNYLKIAWRNLTKYKFISFINLFGLTVGLTCCLLILSYILNEVNYDKFQPNANRTYRISRSFLDGNGVQTLHLSAIAPAFGDPLKTAFPEIEKMTRLLSNGNTAFVYGDKKFYEKKVYFADENLADIFKVDMIKGNPKKALESPFSIMISDEIAKKYFGNEDPIDKIVKLDNNLPCKVSGVYKPFQSNTHLHPNVLISFNTLKDSTIYGERNLQTSFGNNSFYTYIVLPANYDPQKMQSRFSAFLDKYYHFPGEPADFKGSRTTKLFLHKLTDIHLRSHLDDEIETNGDIKRVYIFSCIALFILLIACINYMNLSTARSVLRAKEIGIRKTVGAERKGIIFQFLSESVLVTVIAIILAITLTILLQPLVNKFSGQNISVDTLLRWQVILSIIIAPFAVGILSGLYPALFMSSFQPVKVLKGVFKVKGNLSVRKVLVVSQFAISIILIICTIVVFSQLKYMQQKSLGLNKDHIILMNNPAAFGTRFESFRNELLQNASIKNVTRSSRIPSGRLLDDQGIGLPVGDSVKPLQVDVKMVVVDYNFIPTFGIGMAAGRNFSTDYPTDSSGYILNESAAAILGWKYPSKAINNELVYGGQKGRIIGVTKDFHFESLHQKIVPLIMFPNPNFLNGISVKLSGTNIPGSIATVEKVWKKYLPETPFDYSFLDTRFDKLYEAEQKQESIFTSFSLIAIFIACLGLFGLSAFTISQRIKEIGIRKVLGASVNNIVGLLSKDFLKLVIVAAVIAFPAAWFAMHKWLQDFAYRINIQWWVFILAGVIAAAVAFFTVGLQAAKAATSNPVKNLRTE